MISILRGSLANLDDIASLFSNYRLFYGLDNNERASRSFLKERLINKDSIIFIAYKDTIPCGFVQCYFNFSSLQLSPILVLNDLYICKEYRQQGIATLLLNKVKEFATESHIAYISLCTAQENKIAQSLYEKVGYKIDEQFIYYWLELADK